MDQPQYLLTELYTFEVVARHLSFTKAAEELFLTQGAISHRIRKLETELGFSLFVRLTRRLELTPEGVRLRNALTQSFEQIFGELQDIRFNELRGQLHIGIAPTFAQLWLMPRLPDFQQRWPALNLKLRVKASKLDFQTEPVDLAIYYSSEAHPDFHSRVLFDEELVPVCSPEYAVRQGLDRGDPQRLADCVLIHATESIESVSHAYEWRLWCEAKGLSFALDRREYVFNHFEMALAAARGGIGVALGRLRLVERDLAQGKLVTPFPEPVPASHRYVLICPRGQEQRPRYQAFLGWLDQQIAPA